MRSACPSCPDGYVWTQDGQTGKECPTCKGKAYVGESDDDDYEDSESQTSDMGEFEPPAF